MKLKASHIWSILIVIGVLAAWFILKPTNNNTDKKQATEAVHAQVSNNKAANNTAQTPAKSALTVSIVKPSLQRITQNLSANGSIAPWQEALIGAEVNGLLLNQVYVNTGDTVKKGQILAQFSTTTITADIAQAQASLAEAKASASEATSNAERARSIADSGALSTQQIEQYTTLEATSKARVAASLATLHTQQIRLKQTKVVAPDNGVISSRLATVGAVVSPGQELFRLIRQGRLEWRAELLSSDIGRVTNHMLVDIKLPNGEKLVGKVRSSSPMVDPLTRNATVFVDIPNSPSAKAGMYANGEFNMGENEAVMLPNSAIVLKDGFAYVMQVDIKNKVRELKVTLGKRVGQLVQIIDFENQMNNQFVAVGAAFLADGDTVNVVNVVNDTLKPQKSLTQKTINQYTIYQNTVMATLDGATSLVATHTSIID